MMSPPTRPTTHTTATCACDQCRSSASASTIISKSSTKKRKNKSDEQADEVLEMVEERLRNSATANKDDAFDIFGKHVAAKLRSLPHLTKLYTEKLITDLLFQAELGNIDSNTKIATVANDPTRTYYNNYSQQLQPDGYFCPQSTGTQQGSQSSGTIATLIDSSITTYFGSYQATGDYN
ncbi:unnamed protein product [Ceutorhynchus assimilis]|uniref:BESS domain-containing protein n=1 Tax=Ceutorhynchus assimilis TaxID=467358 RepID=A0A9N9MDM9_9CUCU|nr:unnamed protein product [Ceutorhynchus assimilis]